MLGLKQLLLRPDYRLKPLFEASLELQGTLFQKNQEIISSSTTKKIRKPGGGRKNLSAIDPTLIKDLERLIAPATRGDPCSPLLWTSKSTSKLAYSLKELGHKISPRTVAFLIRKIRL